MSNVIILFIVLFVISASAELAIGAFKKKRYQQLTSAIEKQNYATFNNLYEKKSTRLFIPKYTTEYLRMNVIMAQENKDEIEKQFDVIIDCATNKNQKIDIIMAAYDYYVSHLDRDKAKKYGMQVADLGVEELTKYVHRSFNIFVDHKTKYLNEMLEEIKDENTPNLWQKEHMISVMYGLLNDQQNQKKYEDRAVSHMPANN